MKILVINAGSSSLKYQFIDMSNESVLAKGNCERIGMERGILTYNAIKGTKIKVTVFMKDHRDAFVNVKNMLTNERSGVIRNLSEVDAIGHRIVQGGDIFKDSVLVSEKVIRDIESLIPLAPLHNRAHVQGIRACLEIFGDSIPEVVVFDTSFHSTMPAKAYMYAVPYKYYEKYGVRRYGFHGTSHRYVSNRCAELMSREINELKLITCHLGNGSSITAVANGKVIDTSMGLTPLDGFMMGSRSGTLDPSVVTFIAEKEDFTPSQMNNFLNKKSGLLGISGVSSDDRDVGQAAQDGNKRAQLAHSMFQYQVIKFIGAYVAVMGGVDGIVFTGGIGENEPLHRRVICESLSYLGVDFDDQVNEKLIRGKEGRLSTDSSKVSVFVIPTNEEIIIARDTQAIVLGNANVIGE